MIGATAFPQPVPCPKANEISQEGQNIIVKFVDKEDQNMVSSSRVQAAGGARPAETQAPDLSMQGHRNDVRVHGATNMNERVHGVANSSRRVVHHGGDRRRSIPSDLFVVTPEAQHFPVADFDVEAGT
jgi:hypothetical protein